MIKNVGDRTKANSKTNIQQNLGERYRAPQGCICLRWDAFGVPFLGACGWFLHKDWSEFAVKKVGLLVQLEFRCWSKTWRDRMNPRVPPFLCYQLRYFRRRGCCNKLRSCCAMCLNALACQGIVGNHTNGVAASVAEMFQDVLRDNFGYFCWGGSF